MTADHREPAGRDPVRRRRRRRHRAPHAAGAAARAARAHATDFVVVNGENAAGGLGITPKIADELFAAGVDVITLGNHTYRQREIYAYLDAQRADPAAGELPAQPARPRQRASSSATACGSAS